MIKNKELKEINKYLLFLKSKGIRFEKAIVFGSLAKGKGREDSDIDLAIISKDFEKDPFEVQVKLFKYAAKVSDRIEPIALSSKEFEKESYPLVFEIKRYGKVIYP